MVMDPGKLSQYSDWATDRTTGVPFPATASRPAPELTQSPIQWTFEALLPGPKRPGSEADHSPLCSAEVMNAWNYTSTLPYVFKAN
jgi:hypothetical protein